MHLRVDLTFPADIDDVSAMLADEAFVRWRAQRSTGSVPDAVEQADVTGTTSTGFTVVVRRNLPTDLIPVQAQPFVGAHLEIRHAEAWEPAADGRRTGTVAVEILGAPVRVTATAVMSSLPDGGTRITYDGDVRATVPLFGTVIEEAAVSAVRTTLESEAEAGRDWLVGKHTGPA